MEVMVRPLEGTRGYGGPNPQSCKLRHAGEVFETPEHQVYNAKGEPATWMVNPDGSEIDPVKPAEAKKLHEEAKRTAETQAARERKEREAEAIRAKQEGKPVPPAFAGPRIVQGEPTT